MRRRSRAGGEPVKTRRRKTVTRKRPNAPKAGRNRSVSIASQETVVARLTRERDEALERLSEALEQQTATADVLRVISSSPGELEPIFKRNAGKCRANLRCEVWQSDIARGGRVWRAACTTPQ